MEIIFPKVDLKSTKLSEVIASSLFICELKDLNNEKAYRIKLGFPEKDDKISSIFVLNNDQPCVYKQDKDRLVYVISSSVVGKLSNSTCYLNSVKQQSIFVFEDNKKIVYFKTDKSKENDIGIIEICKLDNQENPEANLDFSGKKIVYKEGDRKIRILDIKFKLDFDEN